MDQSRWVRDPKKVQAALVLQPDDSIITTRDVKIYIPARFIEKKLASVGNETKSVGIFAVVVDDKYYAVNRVDAMMRLTPTTTATVKFDGESYLEFRFAPGSTVYADRKLVRDDGLVYQIFNEMISKGRVPWYLNYEDLGKLFETAESHANVRFGAIHAILEMFAAAIARDPNDRTKFYRHVYEEINGKPKTLPTVIPFVSITFGTTNTTSRLMGSYVDEGMNSALVNPSTRNEDMEDMLRR